MPRNIADHRGAAADSGHPVSLPRHTTVAVIGAGPAGLALGAELHRRQVDFIILEKGSVGDSWSRMPNQLKLVSPWKTNWLTRGTAHRFAPHAQLTRAEFLDYLRAFAVEHELPVVRSCEISSVERSGEGFDIRTSQGNCRAGLVVNATGYFSNPCLPRLPGDERTSISRLHYANFGDAQKIAALAGPDALVLIVGQRLSAGQAALALFDAGLRVAISHRAPIRFGVDDWLWPLVYRTFDLAEVVRLRFPGRNAGQLDVPMPGGRVRKLIQSGAIQTVPALARFEPDSVVLEDGSTLAPQVVLYATGFAPSLSYLRPLALEACPVTGVPLTRNMESIAVPNLFFLGFEMLRNFQSRFLRGLRNDAVVLAAEIERRVPQAPGARRPASLASQRREGLRVRGAAAHAFASQMTTVRSPTPQPDPLPVEGRGREAARRLSSGLRLILYYLRVPITWTALTLHNSWGILNVLDLIWLRPMRGGLIDEHHPFCTGIDPATGESIWLRNVVFKSPRRERWPDSPLAPDPDDEIIRKVGDHLCKQVLMAARSEGHPHGHAAPMPPGILYIHGAVHFNGVWLLFNDFPDAIRHFSDPKFAAEFQRLVREEQREPVTLFRDRDYDRTEFARFVCFLRTLFPWFSNCNGPKKFVLWGNPSPYPAVNTITGHWIRETRALKTEHGRASVARPPVARKYFPDAAYFGERATTRLPENLLAFLTSKRIALRGERENLYFVDKRKLRRGLRFGPEPMPSLWRRMRR